MGLSRGRGQSGELAVQRESVVVERGQNRAAALDVGALPSVFRRRPDVSLVFFYGKCRYAKSSTENRREKPRRNNFQDHDTTPFGQLYFLLGPSLSGPKSVLMSSTQAALPARPATLRILQFRLITQR